MISTSAAAAAATKSKRPKIPAYLVRETIDGVDSYYPDFWQVENVKVNIAVCIEEEGFKLE